MSFKIFKDMSEIPSKIITQINLSEKIDNKGVKKTRSLITLRRKRNWSMITKYLLF